MKKLLFLLLLVFCIQCKDQAAKEKCGIVTEMVTIASDTKSKPKTVPVSYYSCEYVVIMPQSRDSFEVIKLLEPYKFQSVKVSAKDPSLWLCSDPIAFNPRIADTLPAPGGNPLPPPIKSFRNTVIINPKGQRSSFFEGLEQSR